MRTRLERLKQGDTAQRDSRPIAPAHDDRSDLGSSRDHGEEEDDPSDTRQLHSIHSLVLYHHLTLDRILRACMLSPEVQYEAIYKILMSLFGSVLDLGKLVKEVERGVVDWQKGEEEVKGIATEWQEQEGIFVCWILLDTAAIAYFLW